MIRIVKTTRSRRPRDNGRFALIIGRGAGKRVFHLSPVEMKQLAKDADKARRKIEMSAAGMKSFYRRFPRKTLKNLAESFPEVNCLR